MRFAFISPRYGADIGSGPEHACRLLAEQVSRRHDVDVLTTCASNPDTWTNDSTEGTDRVRGVLVRRFAVSQSHDARAFGQFTHRLLSGPRALAEEVAWSRQLGPVSTALLDHLKRQHRSYDALVFFSLEHTTTVEGTRIAPERSIVFPCLHLQPALRFGLWAELLTTVGAVAYFSDAERHLLRHYVGVVPRAEEVVGIGIDPPPQLAYPRHQQDPADALGADEDEEDAGEPEAAPHLTGRGVTFRRRHRLYGPFALYGGRVEPDNGCEEMLEYFAGYAERRDDLPLVLMGVKMMKVPEQRDLVLAGVLPDRERMTAYEAADVTIAPASDDLLAQAPLESFAVGTPVLASARNPAAVAHCLKSNAGLFYASRDEFIECLDLLAHDTRMREALGENGRQYVRQYYRWDQVLSRLDRLVSRVRSR
jgi:glycosyltransferase involved in cell wall biosynthesis